MRHTSIFVVIALPFAAAACTDVQSSDIKTAGMSAYMSVTADATGQSAVVAQLNVDDNITDFVTLSNGDTLVASVAGQPQTMSRSDLLNDISYSASFSGEGAAGLAYTVAFNRTSDTSAPSSTCTLPTPFNVTAPATGGTFSRANDAIVVTYDTAGTSDAMGYTLSGVCVKVVGATGVMGDPGTFTLAKGALAAADSSDPSQTCQVTLTVSRTRNGQLDPAFGSGGQIACAQARTLTFTSTP